MASEDQKDDVNDSGDDSNDTSDTELEYSGPDSPPENLSPQRNPTPVQILSEDDLQNQMSTMSSRLSEVLGIPANYSRALLEKNKWNMQVVIDRMATADFDVSSVIPEASEFSRRPCGSSGEVCEICLEEGQQLIGLRCAHWACEDCWRAHIDGRVRDGAVNVECMATGCLERVGEDNLLEYMDPTLTESYHRQLLNNFVNTSTTLRWCPGADCKHAIKTSNTAPQVAVCTCGCRFCSSCGEEWHEPLDCQNLRRWNRLCEQQPPPVQPAPTEPSSEPDRRFNYIRCPRCDAKLKNPRFCKNCSWDADIEEEWLMTHRGYRADEGPTIVKVCPKCHIHVWKDGGCDSMECEKCEYAFKWSRQKKIGESEAPAQNAIAPPTKSPNPVSDYLYEAHLKFLEEERRSGREGMFERMRQAARDALDSDPTSSNAPSTSSDFPNLHYPSADVPSWEFPIAPNYFASGSDVPSSSAQDPNGSDDDPLSSYKNLFSTSSTRSSRRSKKPTSKKSYDPPSKKSRASRSRSTNPPLRNSAPRSDAPSTSASQENVAQPFSFYYEQYKVLQQRLVLAEKLHARIDARIQAAPQSTHDFSFLQRALQTLTDSTRSLMFTYPLAFFLEQDDAHTRLLEHNQRELQTALTKFTELLVQVAKASDLMWSKDRVQQMEDMLRQMAKHLVERVNEGYEEELWKFKE